MSDVRDIDVEYQKRREEVLRSAERGGVKLTGATRAVLLEALMQERFAEIGLTFPALHDQNVVDAIAGWVRPTPTPRKYREEACQVCGTLFFGRQSRERTQYLVDRHDAMHAKEERLRKKYPGLLIRCD